jgi:hypothetical protein
MNSPTASDLATARLNSRLGGIEQKMERVVQIHSCLRDKGFNARIARAERRIRDACHKVEMPVRAKESDWLGRIAKAIQRFR